MGMEIFWICAGMGLGIFLIAAGIGLASYLEDRGEALKIKARKEKDEK